MEVTNLTLTRVVFECYKANIEKQNNSKFNFNKSCIWIYIPKIRTLPIKNLTLTRVVFEFNWLCLNKISIWI